jgi:peptidoglycan biosynthesis protein MviN/MurJ (putative lipid II flippase)
MVSEGTTSAPALAAEKPGSFFRQSGWLMIANIIGGAMALGVHFLNKRIPDAEYSIFGTLLMVTAFLPTMPLQMVFAQQAASATVLGRERQFAAMIRRASLGIVGAWLLMALGVTVFQGQIMKGWELTNSFALVVTLLAVLASLLVPLFTGVLQGRQDFLWMGWAAILGAIARIAVAAVLVLGFSGGATSMMMGAFLGSVVGLGIALWRSRDLWTMPGEAFDGKGLWRQIGPLILGFGVCQFMFTTDTMYAKAFFSGDEMKRYVAAGTLSRALLWLVLPLAAVMFPKLVQSSAKAEKTNLFNLVILGTAILAICGALGLWLVGPWVVKLIFKPEDVPTTVALLPWYTGAMIPLALANVMANDLLARARFKVVPFMVLIGVGYAVALPLLLQKFPGRMEVVLQTLAGFNLLLLAVCAWFTYRNPAPTGNAAPSASL